MFEVPYKKTVSSSFSNAPSDALVNQKYSSFSVDKINSIKSVQKIQQKKIVSSVIDHLNSSNVLESHIIWRLILFEQKRNIPGFKAKIEWHDARRDMKISIKISFSSNYYRFFNNLHDNDIFAEIQQLNFQLDYHQKKTLQEQTEKFFAESIETTKLKNYNDDETKKPSECLRLFLESFNKELEKNIYKNKKKSTINKIDKQLSKKMILYPSPANIAWNPLGYICITENKYPSNKKSFFAEPNTLRRYFENNQYFNMQNIKDEQINQNQADNNTPTNVNSIYQWKIEQQINLLIFNQTDSKQEERFYNNESITNLQVQNKKEIKKKYEDYIDVAYINRIPSLKLRKIYERYFGEMERIFQFRREDKLKVYEVKRSKCPYEDDINYLVEKLSSNSSKSKIHIVFQNELSLYPNLSSKMDLIKYKIISKLITQNLQNAKIAYSMNLKIFILENQYFDTLITNYFKQLYRISGKKLHYQLYFMASYLHFDNIKAEFFFIDILESFLAKNETKNTTISTTTQPDFNIKIKTRLKLPKIEFESVISESNKNAFLMNLFQLLIVKDRQKQKHEYRYIKRIIAANNKIFKFIKKVNELLTKLQEGKVDFIKNLIQKYKQFNYNELFEEMNIFESKRIFFFYCINCNKISKIYDLVKENLQICERCKQIVFNE